MPAFVVVGHRVRTDGNFTLKDLAGSTGRLDVLLRCVNSAFMLSNDIRRDVEVFLIHLGEPEPPKTVRFVGEELKYVNPDERSTGALVKSALEKNVGDREVRSTPGIYVSKDGLAEIFSRLSGRRLVYLKEGGKNVRRTEFSENDVFVLGGQNNLTPDEEELIEKTGNVEKISLGPKSLHADHCITIVLNELDRKHPA